MKKKRKNKALSQKASKTLDYFMKTIKKDKISLTT